MQEYVSEPTVCFLSPFSYYMTLVNLILFKTEYNIKFYSPEQEPLFQVENFLLNQFGFESQTYNYEKVTTKKGIPQEYKFNFIKRIAYTQVLNDLNNCKIIFDLDTELNNFRVKQMLNQLPDFEGAYLKNKLIKCKDQVPALQTKQKQILAYKKNQRPQYDLKVLYFQFIDHSNLPDYLYQLIIWQETPSIESSVETLVNTLLFKLNIKMSLFVTFEGDSSFHRVSITQIAKLYQGLYDPQVIEEYNKKYQIIQNYACKNQNNTSNASGTQQTNFNQYYRKNSSLKSSFIKQN